MSVMSQCYSIIIDQGISAPGHVKVVVYGLNYVDKCYIYQLISTVQLNGSNIFDYHMKMHTGNQKYYVSLAEEFQHHLTKEHCKMVCLTREKTINNPWKENGQTDIIIFRIMLILPTKMWECTVTHIIYHIGGKNQHYPEYDTVRLSIFFPWIVYCFFPDQKHHLCDAILSDGVEIP